MEDQGASGEPERCQWGQQQPFDPTGPEGGLWDLLVTYKVYGDLWGPRGAMGSDGDPMGAHGDLRGDPWGPRGYLGTTEDVWGPMGSFGDLWGHTRTYGAFFRVLVV